MSQSAGILTVFQALAVEQLGEGDASSPRGICPCLLSNDGKVVSVIDENGFRLNVGVVVVNHQGQCLWGRRAGNPSAWQFPQGGIEAGESERETMYRELYEELGLSEADVQILAMTPEWLCYVLPSRYQRSDQKPLCVGQKQRWFLLRLVSDDSRIQLDCCHPSEFDQWCWVDYWHPLTAVVEFKRDVYRQVLAQFAPYVVGK